MVPHSSQYEAFARYRVSREVPRSILKFEMLLGTLDATPKFPNIPVSCQAAASERLGSVLSSSLLLITAGRSVPLLCLEGVHHPSFMQSLHLEQLVQSKLLNVALIRPNKKHCSYYNLTMERGKINSLFTSGASDAWRHTKITAIYFTRWKKYWLPSGHRRHFLWGLQVQRWIRYS